MRMVDYGCRDIVYGIVHGVFDDCVDLRMRVDLVD